MLFLLLLILSTVAVAGSAAYFSVYGLAATFSGVFMSVIIMGASLEAAKLMTASYLYRYWNETGKLLRTYMIAGVIGLMVLTSGGIFGYLSSGYQADVLPLKQLNEQIALLTEEKQQLLNRKKEIDTQIAQLPANYVRGRERLISQFKQEQQTITNRLAEISKVETDAKLQQIKTEAHIGPITYISKAFGVETDDATKWLVLLIVLVFDPMAIALTLAVNNVLRLQKEEKATRNQTEQVAPKEIVVEKIVEVPVEIEKIVEVPVERIVEKIVEVPVDPKPEQSGPTETDKDPKPEQLAPAPKRHIRPYPNKMEGINDASKIEEVVRHYKFLREKEIQGQPLTNDEKWDIESIRKLLHKRGLDVYLD